MKISKKKGKKQLEKLDQKELKPVIGGPYIKNRSSN